MKSGHFEQHDPMCARPRGGECSCTPTRFPDLAVPGYTTHVQVTPADDAQAELLAQVERVREAMLRERSLSGALSRQVNAELEILLKLLEARRDAIASRLVDDPSP